MCSSGTAAAPATASTVQGSLAHPPARNPQINPCWATRNQDCVCAEHQLVDPPLVPLPLNFRQGDASLDIEQNQNAINIDGEWGCLPITALGYPTQHMDILSTLGLPSLWPRARSPQETDVASGTLASKRTICLSPTRPAIGDKDGKFLSDSHPSRRSPPFSLPTSKYTQHQNWM